MLLSRFLLLFAGAQSALATCKCTPTDTCWPSLSKWNSLNASVHGQLVLNTPIAKPCYPGPGQDKDLCQDISREWNNALFQEKYPVGYTYPLVDSCPPINASVPSYGVCDLGNSPVYTINATRAEDVAAGITFAKNNNVRLVIKNTGHDATRRSQGYGSLMIWIRNIRNGLHYQDYYTSSDGFCQSNWTDSAITVGGGYIWRDVYAFAAKHGRIVVGGDDRTVGSIGGYLQGGGHGPASHAFGLATDQVLEYQVVLASGEIITANACQNTDLFTALRGGGGGTFGVVVSATIKAYQTRSVLVHQAEIVPLESGDDGANSLLNVTAELLARFPTLLDAGFAGYVKLVQSGEQRVYQHFFVNLLESNTSAAVQQAKQMMQKQVVDDLLLPLNGTSMFAKSSFQFVPTFGEYTSGVGSKQDVAGPGLMMAFRFFDKKSLHDQQESLLDMFHTMFSQDVTGVLPLASMFDIGFIGGGKVLESVPHTSVNPAWRRTYGLARYIDIWPDNADLSEIQQINDGVTFKKLDAMKALTPGMGAYLNEADGDNPEWREDWFGGKYNWLKSVKDKYDPEGVFWCWRCVGSERWEEVKGGTVYGPLCKV